MVWTAGQTLHNGKYRIEKELGRGGVGVTFLAMHQELLKQVVIKTLNRESIREQVGRSRFPRVLQTCEERFRKEAKLLARCEHPNIVRVIDICEEAGVAPDQRLLFMVMDYVPGRNLTETVKHQGALPEATALAYVTQVGAALTGVHSIGLLHRDVKPQNIMINRRNNQAILIDFGIAREFSRDTHTIAYSPGYASPEQQNGKCTIASDVYSLAATLFFLLTEDIPPNASFLQAPEYSESLQNLAAQVSPRVYQAILKGLSYRPEDRPQTVAEWLQELGCEADLPVILAEPEDPTHTVQSLPLEPDGQTAVSSPETFPQASSEVAFSNRSGPALETSTQVSSPDTSPQVTTEPLRQSQPSAETLVSPPPEPSLAEAAPQLPNSPATVVSQLEPGISRTVASPLPLPAPPTPPLVRGAGRQYRDQRRLVAGVAGGLLLAGVVGSGWFVLNGQAQQRQAQEQATLDQAKRLAQTDPGAAVKKAQELSSGSPLHAEAQKLSAGWQAQQLLQDARSIAQTDLEQAIRKAQEIQPGSPAYDEARTQIFAWRGTTLEQYLQDKLKAIPDLAQLNPKVQVQSDQVTISYASANDRALTVPERVKIVAVIVMELLRGNENNSPPIPSKYTDFAQLVVYPQDGNQQVTVTAEQWASYLKRELSVRQLLEAVQVGNRAPG